MRSMLLTLMLTAALSSAAAAQSVIVDGMGIDKDSAVNDASRLAVEQAVGALIDSRTLMKDLTVELDEVYKKSQGFIRKIDILSEGGTGGNYRVKAKIDVDTDPNGALMDNLTMLMRLNDPRIAVVVLNGWKDDAGRAAHNEDLEHLLAAKLLEMNFTHVLDANHVIKLYNAELLNNIYEGNKGLSVLPSDNACEFLVLGKVTASIANISIPDHRTGQMLEAPLTNAKAKLVLKVIKYDTGDIIGAFVSEDAGIGSNNARAFDTALSPLGEAAAGKLTEIFRSFGAKSSQGGVRITINADHSNADAITDLLRSLQGVDNVYIRSQGNNQTILEVETMQKPHIIYQLLRSRSRLPLVSENMTANSMVLRVRQ